MLLGVVNHCLRATMKYCRREEEENLFAKKVRCQKGLQRINAGYRRSELTSLLGQVVSTP